MHEKVKEQASEGWMEEGGVEEKWLEVHFALKSAAEDVLGTTTHHHPDWFCDSLES